MGRLHRLLAVWTLLLAALCFPAAAAAAPNVTITNLDCGYKTASNVFLPTTTVTRDGSDTGEQRVRVLARLFDGGTQLKSLSQGPVQSDGTAVPGTGDINVGEEMDFRPWSRAFGDGTPEGGGPLLYDHDYTIRTEAFDFDTDETDTLTETCTTPPAPKVKLTVLRSGEGTGAVKAGDGSIDCGSTCTHEYDKGAHVALTATAAAGSVFAGWSGGGCSGTAGCAVTLDTPTSVQARFDVKPTDGGPPPPVCLGKSLFGAAQEAGFNQYTLFETKPSGQPFFTLELTAAPGEMQVCREDGLTAPSTATLLAGYNASSGRIPFPVTLADGTVRNLVFDLGRLGWAVPATAAGRELTTRFDPALSVEPAKPSSIDIFDPLATGIDIVSFTAFKLSAPVIGAPGAPPYLLVESTPKGTLALKLKGDDLKCATARWAESVPKAALAGVMSQAMAAELSLQLRDANGQLDDDLATRFPTTLGAGLRPEWQAGLVAALAKLGPLDRAKWGLGIACKLRVRFPRLHLSPEAIRAAGALSAAMLTLQITAAILTRNPAFLVPVFARKGASSAQAPPKEIKNLSVKPVVRPRVRRMRVAAFPRKRVKRIAQDVVDIPARGRLMPLATDVPSKRLKRKRSVTLAALGLANRRRHTVLLVVAGPGYRAERSIEVPPGGRLFAKVALPRRKARGQWTIAAIDRSKVRPGKATKLKGKLDVRLTTFKAG